MILSFVITTTVVLAIFAVGLGVEHVVPAQRQQATAIRVNIFLAFVQCAVTTLVAAIPVLGISALGGSLIALPSEGWEIILSVVVYVFLIDFAHYEAVLGVSFREYDIYRRNTAFLIAGFY